jgi:fucose 4-O-acetylase-like acetyltransferase
MNKPTSTAAAHQNFIDWLKATGMILIVIGHTVGSPDALFNSVSAPIYSKQLGVAFFVFVAGWGLGNHHRPRFEEAFKRLFPILFYGGVCALLMSAITWIDIHDLAESNYLPLALGVNVFLNYFPANPTTWYIGMYLHLVLL